MERSNKTVTERAVSFTFYGFFIMMLFMAGCAMQDENPVPVTDEAFMEFSDAQAKKIDLQGEMINLEGFAKVYFYAVKEQRIIMDGGLPCTATLIHVNAQIYNLVTQEWWDGMLAREINFSAKITPGGIIKYSVPVPFPSIDFADGTEFDNAIDQLEYTTGYTFHGAGVNKKTIPYKGTFDGERLYAEANFMALHERLGTMFPYNEELVDGPIKLKFYFDLTVVDD